MSGDSNPTNPKTPPARPRLTDSPWFWLLVFANAAVVGLALIGPKYDRRQGAIERRYEARQEIAGRMQAQPTAAAPGDTAPGDTGSVNSAPIAEPAPVEEASPARAHIVPLWPLATALVLLNSVAIVLFCMNHLRQARPTANSDSQQP